MQNNVVSHGDRLMAPLGLLATDKGDPRWRDAPTSCAGPGTAVALGATDWLALAASPTWAIMALATGILGGDASGAMCLGSNASPLTGMLAMYLLMSVFHAAPWLKRIARRPRACRKHHATDVGRPGRSPISG
jgi:hypothetical protein